MTAILSLQDLTIQTRTQRLVSGVSLDIAPGERWGLIGESGSGKSLTALAAIGLLPPTLSVSGRIVLDGQPVHSLSEGALTRLRGQGAAVIFQEPLTALDPLMRLGRQVSEPIIRRRRRTGDSIDRKEIAAEIMDIFERVALPEPARIAQSYPYEISGGQRQRVAIAMALACRPKLLIADEPTTALDVTTQGEILKLLKELVADMGMTLLFISHDLAVVGSIAQHIAVMRHGMIVERGEAQSVLGDPQHEYTQTLLAAAQAFDTALMGRS